MNDFNMNGGGALWNIANENMFMISVYFNNSRSMQKKHLNVLLKYQDQLYENEHFNIFNKMITILSRK